MPKPILLVVGAVAAVVVVGGVVVATQKKDTNKNTTTTSTTKTTAVKVDDPDGTYKFVSDPSVTKYPEKDAMFGNGQTMTFEYDGSKTDNDSAAKLSYQLYYIQDNGKVIPMGGGNMEGTGKGTFTTSDKVFDSAAKNRSGFFELQGTTTSGKNVVLGMYPIKFDISD